MSRYCLEVFYKGTAYAGFQVQENANTVQAEVEKALQIYFRSPFELTGSSRTDAGVHALQNFFHFDHAESFSDEVLQDAPYHLNAILPEDIVIRSLMRKADDFHCRFDARSREYHYFVYRRKDPFMQDRGYFFPFRLDLDLMRQAAAGLMKHHHFAAFAKKHGQAKTFDCQIFMSEWVDQGDVLVYKVRANRFLRGMVRGLVGTMLRVGTGKLTPAEFDAVIEEGDSSRADFSVPPQGLFLVKVSFEEEVRNVEK
jgi:tRNA pseudouridine38-40 synthase